MDVSAYFTDPDEDALSYAAESTEAAIATVKVSGDSVIVSAVAQGRATVTVTATDPGGLSAEQSFAVNVPNRTPTVVDPLPGLKVFTGDSGAVNLSRHFADPDGDSLAFAAETADATVAAVAVAGGVLTVMGVSQGKASVTVRASDPGGLSAEQRFTVTVPNRAPVPTDSIPALELFKGDRDGLDASRHFADPDGDALTYATRTSDAAVATARVSGDSLFVSAVSQGRATLTVTATDPGGLSAAQILAVTVPNRAPVGVDSIPALELYRGEVGGVEVSAYFTDPDEDGLSYAVGNLGRGCGGRQGVRRQRDRVCGGAGAGDRHGDGNRSGRAVRRAGFRVYGAEPGAGGVGHDSRAGGLQGRFRGRAPVATLFRSGRGLAHLRGRDIECDGGSGRGVGEQWQRSRACRRARLR